MKLAIIGGGGFRVPLVYGALLRRRPFDDVVLYDVDAGRLERVALVLDGQAAEHGDRVPFRTTTDLDDALEGADFVFVAIRVGGLQGRTVYDKHTTATFARVVDDCATRIRRSVYKRLQGPPIVAVSERAFGFDLRETIINGFKGS